MTFVPVFVNAFHAIASCSAVAAVGGDSKVEWFKGWGPIFAALIAASASFYSARKSRAALLEVQRQKILDDTALTGLKNSLDLNAQAIKDLQARSAIYLAKGAEYEFSALNTLGAAADKTFKSIHLRAQEKKEFKDDDTTMTLLEDASHLIRWVNVEGAMETWDAFHQAARATFGKLQELWREDQTGGRGHQWYVTERNLVQLNVAKASLEHIFDLARNAKLERGAVVPR